MADNHQSNLSNHESKTNRSSYQVDEIWSLCLESIAKELPSAQFDAWIKPLNAILSEDGEKLTLFVSNRFKLDWLRSQYSALIIKTLRTILKRNILVEFAINKKSGIKQNVIPNIQPSKEDKSPSATNLRRSSSKEKTEEATNLNPDYRFENLVEGSANRMARAASLHIACVRGNNYNPLFIYGGVGLGKTHLIHAIGNKLIEENPKAKVLYIHAERFVSDVVQAYQKKTFDSLKQRYHKLDLLLIDDVQFIANKERTQEEFFNTFEALLAKKSHIVLTSDTYPKGLSNIHSRLISRFDCGLTVAIDPPEFEMRVAILMSKAEQEKAVLPEDVAFFIAKNVRSNVRELEGALRKVLAFAKFNHKEISIPLAKESLKDLLMIKNQQVSIENIQKAVADFYKIKVADMYSKRRPTSIARPRQIAMYLAKELTQKSLPEIGELFGGRDHTTILHAVKKISKERLQFADLNQELHILEQTIKG